jgi:hypothetical protein
MCRLAGLVRSATLALDASESLSNLPAAEFTAMTPNGYNTRRQPDPAIVRLARALARKDR